MRQPPVIDDEDIFLGISLYVTNDMLDEALYFQKQYQNDDNEEILLEHLFKGMFKKQLFLFLNITYRVSTKTCPNMGNFLLLEIESLLNGQSSESLCAH